MFWNIYDVNAHVVQPQLAERVSDDEDGDGLTFGGKQHLHVDNYILLVPTQRPPAASHSANSLLRPVCHEAVSSVKC